MSSENFSVSRLIQSHSSFEEVNTCPDIQEALRSLYETPEMIELYPGIFCEGNGRIADVGSNEAGTEKLALWSGLFADAVTLVRSDRFFTVLGLFFLPF
jgi:hypothetical protein